MSSISQAPSSKKPKHKSKKGGVGIYEKCNYTKNPSTFYLYRRKYQGKY